jgi:hypothetical protein
MMMGLADNIRLKETAGSGPGILFHEWAFPAVINVAREGRPGLRHPVVLPFP